MEVRAQARYVRVSPRKARIVVDLVRGKSVAQAQEILRFTNRGIAETVEKVLNSAVANAEHNNHLRAESLVVKKAYVDEGPTMKRIRPRKGFRRSHPQAHEPHHDRRRPARGGIKHMGQKVNPTGFRIGVTEDWRSRWYADKNYATNLANDLEIREFLNKQLSRAAVSKVEIERAGDKIKVIVTTARPGVVIGKKGAEIDALRKKLEKVAVPSSMRTLSLSPLLSSSKAAWPSAVRCARPCSPLARAVPRASASSAPAVSVVPR